MKTLAELQRECSTLGISVTTTGRPSKELYIKALRQFHWERSFPGQPLPPQLQPMLLAAWEDLDEAQAEQIEQDDSGWVVQPKLDGVRALLHVEGGKVRITGRTISDVSFRLTEFQDNLPHLTAGFDNLVKTILDGELTCPINTLETGNTVTTSPLQAAVAILATSPKAAQQIQESSSAQLRFHAFDILRFGGDNMMSLSLEERLGKLANATSAVVNPYLESVPSFVIGKPVIHQRAIETGNEGTVWKHLNQPYEPGRRVRHWIKRKRELSVEGFVSSFKPGRPENGHAHLVGAVEFSVREPNGTITPIAWVSGWTDQEREAMTDYDGNGKVRLNPSYLGRRALLRGHDFSAKSGRVRHARFLKWLSASGSDVPRNTRPEQPTQAA